MTAPPLAVVSGAASGIGLALSHELVARSFEVVAIDREPMPLASLPGIHAFQLDAGAAAAMQHIADSFAGRPLTWLFANAGIVANALASGAAAGNPFTDYLLEAMRSAEPASAFAARVLERLENAAAPPPFYWLTHADSVRKLAARHRAIVVDGMPTVDFGSLQ